MPPDFIEALVVEVVCQSLIFTAGKIGRLTRRRALDRTRLGKLLRADGGVEGALREAARGLSQLADIESDLKADAIRDFLSSAEVEGIVRRVFAVDLASHAGERVGKAGKEGKLDDGAAARQVRKEFVELFERAVGASGAVVEATGESLFTAVQKSCVVAMTQMIEDRELGAHEALSGARFALIRGEIGQIRKRLDEPASDSLPDLATYRDFEERYRSSVRTVHRHIKPPHLLDEEQRVPIEKLYVAPILLASGVNDSVSGNPVGFTLTEFIRRAFRVVLLGNPGGGKSTFVQNLCVSLSNDEGKPFYDGRRITPVRVVLREYSADRHEHGCSIIDHIEKVANKRYQVRPPPGAIEHLLRAGRILVLFDGLDELLITQHRRDIRTDIEAFCGLYPGTPVIATSRVIGYDQAPLDGETFTEFRLGQFQREDVYQYGLSWYRLMGTPDGSSPEDRAARLVQETRDIADLAANPLMLALICNLSKAMRELPQSRPKIFEACSEMLFRKWDAQHGFAPVLPFDDHIQPTLEHLANWIYTDETLQAGVERAELVEEAAAYLVNGRFPTQAEAEDAAEAFIAHCTGRAWVFSDTGSTAEGELLYEFTHRTFLEYYAAQYVVSRSDGIDEVVDWLVPRVATATSDEVTQLVTHILCRQRERARDRILPRLMENIDGNDQVARWHSEYFVARCFEFIVPPVAITDRVVSSTVSRLIEWAEEPYLAKQQAPEPLAALGATLRCSHENRPIVRSALERTLAEKIEGAAYHEPSALELALGLSEALRRTTMDSVIPRDLLEEMQASGREAIVTARESIETQAADSFLAGRCCLQEDWLTLAQFLTRFGMGSLFRPITSVVFKGVSYESIAQALARKEGDLDPKRTREDLTAMIPLGDEQISERRRLELLAQIGQIARIQTESWMHTAPRSTPTELLQREDVRRSPGALFGAICLNQPGREAMANEGGTREQVLAAALDGSDEKRLAAKLKVVGVGEVERRHLKGWTESRFTLAEQDRWRSLE
jgi:hypothetical protein